MAGLAELAFIDPAELDAGPPEPVDVMVVIEAGDDPADFDANLAEAMSEDERGEIAEEILDLVEGDAKAREEWDKLAKRGHTMLGLSITERDRREASGPQNQDNDDKYWTHHIAHPLLAEAIVRFQAQAQAEICPPEGPAKGAVLTDEPTRELEQQAARVARLINWLATDRCREWQDQTDRLLFLIALDGVVYTKVTWDPDRFIRRMLVRSHDVWIPWHATTFDEAPRVTHRMRWHPSRIKRLQDKGWLLKEVEVGDAVHDDRPGAETEAEATVGVDASAAADIGDRPIEILEVYTDYRLTGPGLPDDEAPYVFTFARTDRELLAVRRNWRPEDDERRPWQLLTQWPFVLGDHPGPYAYGLPHLIGSLSETATDLLRSALDIAAKHAKPSGFLQSALLNAPGFDRSPLKPGELRAAPTTIEDLQRAIFFLPAGDGGPLATVLQFIVEAGQRFASTADLQVGVGDSRSPVGTTLALIEQGSRIYTSIHGRLHRAQRRELQTVMDLIGTYTSPERPYPFSFAGETMPILPDFDGRVDVTPVSDPRIISQTQRLAIAQGLHQLAINDPAGMFDMHEVYRRLLVALRVPDPDRVLKAKREGDRRDAVSENMLMLFGKPIRAYYEQDHAAHLAVHEQWFAGLPAEGQQQLMPKFFAHMGEHMAFRYRVEMEMAVSQLTQTPPGAILPPPPEPGEDEPGETPEMLPPQIERMIDAAAAQAAQFMAAAGQGGGGQSPEQMEAERKARETEIKAQSMEIKAQQVKERMQLDQGKELAKVKMQEAQLTQQAEIETARIQLEQGKELAKIQMQKAQLEQQAEIETARLALERERLAQDAAESDKERAYDANVEALHTTEARAERRDEAALARIKLAADDVRDQRKHVADATAQARDHAHAERVEAGRQQTDMERDEQQIEAKQKSEAADRRAATASQQREHEHAEASEERQIKAAAARAAEDRKARFAKAKPKPKKS